MLVYMLQAIRHYKYCSEQLPLCLIYIWPKHVCLWGLYIYKQRDIDIRGEGASVNSMAVVGSRSLEWSVAVPAAAPETGAMTFNGDWDVRRMKVIPWIMILYRAESKTHRQQRHGLACSATAKGLALNAFIVFWTGSRTIILSVVLSDVQLCIIRRYNILYGFI